MNVAGDTNKFDQHLFLAPANIAFPAMVGKFFG